MPSGLIDLVLHLRQFSPRFLSFRMDLLHLALLLNLHANILQPPPIADRHDQSLDIIRKGQITRMQGHRRIHKRHLFAINLNHVALQPGSNRILSTPAESSHPNLLAPGSRASQRLQEIHADLVSRRLLVPRHPHDKRRRASKHARILCKCRLISRVDWNQNVGNLERHGIALEEVWEEDQPFAAFGVGVGD